MRRVMMFLNPLLIHNAKRRAQVEQIAELLSGYGSDVHLQETLSAHSAGQQARDAVAAGFDTFLVCGGDGTVFQVIQGVAGSDGVLCSSHSALVRLVACCNGWRLRLFLLWAR